MVEFESKTTKVRRLLDSGKLKEALRIAKTFRMGLTKSDRDIICRAYEALIHPESYRQLGQDPAKNLYCGLERLRKLCYKDQGNEDFAVLES